MENLNFIPCEHFTCDHEKNKNIFNLFDECLSLLENLNLDFIVGGSMGLILNTNKYYRTIGDIDFVVKNHLDLKTIAVFQKNRYNYIYKKGYSDIFVKNKTKVEFHALFIPYENSIKNAIKVDYKDKKLKTLSIDEIFYCKNMQSKGKFNFKHVKDAEFFKS